MSKEKVWESTSMFMEQSKVGKRMGCLEGFGRMKFKRDIRKREDVEGMGFE